MSIHTFVVSVSSVILYIIIHECLKKILCSKPKLYKKMETMPAEFVENVGGPEYSRDLWVRSPSGTIYYRVIRQIYDYKTGAGYLIVRRLDSDPKDDYDIFLVNVEKSGVPLRNALIYSAKCNYLAFESKENKDQFIKIWTK